MQGRGRKLRGRETDRGREAEGIIQRGETEEERQRRETQGW